MEEQYKNIDRLTKKIVEDAGMHSPSVNFLDNVMSAVEAKSVQKTYEPLISKKAWMVIAALFIGWLGILYFYPATQLNFIKELNLSQRFSIKNPLAGLQISKSLAYAIGFMALFLIQIPFLKHFLNKRYA